MHISKQDPRSEATRNSIIKAYLKLLSQKNRNTISVKDILLAANVHKSTFYRHFHNVSEIDDFIENDIIERFQKILDETDLSDLMIGRKVILEKIKSTLYGDFAEYRNIFISTLGSQIIERVFQRISVFLQRLLTSHSITDAFQTSVFLTFMIGGKMAVYREWIIGGCRESVDDLSETLEKISLPSLIALMSSQSST